MVMEEKGRMRTNLNNLELKLKRPIYQKKHLLLLKEN
jgi:hypothetical protein